MTNAITSYELLESFGKHFIDFPQLKEDFKDANRKTDVNDYSVNCLTFRKDVPENDAKNVRSRLKGEILEMGYDTLESFIKRYEECDGKEKKFGFLRYINPFASGKTRKERLQLLPYAAPIVIGVGLDFILPAVGLNTSHGGTIIGGMLNAEGIVFSEISRRRKEKDGREGRKFIVSKLHDPKTQFFSDFLEQTEKIDVKFTTVEPANKYIENTVLPATNFAEIDFIKVNATLIEEYECFASQPKA